LTTGAIATSSPSATLLSEQGHILHSQAKPKWSTVSVEAATATLADSLSTAMVLAPRDQIEAMKEQSDIIRITLIGFDGDLITI
jgi:thiamine biosynthesis lipoprotein